MTNGKRSSSKWVLAGSLSVGLVSLGLVNGVFGPQYAAELRAEPERAAGTAEAATATGQPAGAGEPLRKAVPGQSARRAEVDAAGPLGEPTATAGETASPIDEAATAAPETSSETAAPPESSAERDPGHPVAAQTPPPAGVRAAGHPSGDGSPGLGPTSRQGGGTLYFATRSSALGDAERQVLWDIGTRMKKDPSARATVRGHADERGDAAFNDWLARRRAEVAAAFLVSMGVAIDRITIVGHGSSRPLERGDSPDALAHNRRVEVELRN